MTSVAPDSGEFNLRLQKQWGPLSMFRYLHKQQTPWRARHLAEPGHLVNCRSKQSPSTHGSETQKSLGAECFENQSTSLNEYKQRP